MKEIDVVERDIEFIAPGTVTQAGKSDRYKVADRLADDRPIPSENHPEGATYRIIYDGNINILDQGGNIRGEFQSLNEYGEVTHTARLHAKSELISFDGETMTLALDGRLNSTGKEAHWHAELEMSLTVTLNEFGHIDGIDGTILIEGDLPNVDEYLAPDEYWL